MEKIIARLKEPSSWAAIGAALAVFGIEATPEAFQAITQTGTGAALLAAIILGERGDK